MPRSLGEGFVPARVLTFVVLLSALATETVSAGVVIPLDPRATYLRTNNDPGSLDATPIDLAALGILPGDLIYLERLGDYSFDVLGPPIRPDDVTNLVGVFSSTSDLLSSDSLHRVPGAMPAVGYIPLVSWTTDPTFDGGLPTDIPEDFYIGPAAVYVPAGAGYLFVSPADSRFFDNGDPDGN